MGTFRDVTTTEPCPVCGKPDWCSIFTPDEAVYPGQELCVCRRIHSPEIQSAINSKTYYFIKELSDGSAMYSDVAKNSQTSPSSYVYRGSSAVPPKEIDYGTPPRPNAELDIIYREFLGLLQLSKKHRRTLANDGWPYELIKDCQIRSLSLKKSYCEDLGYYSDRNVRFEICSTLINRQHNLEGVPGFYQEQDGKWTFVGKPGMLIPLYDELNQIYRLRLRLDKPDIDENGKEKNKYKNFSSFARSTKEDHVLKNIYLKGCRAGSNIGFYCSDQNDLSMCYITEGEKKAIVANYFFNCIVISLPGVNSYMKLEQTTSSGQSWLDFLKHIGCKNIIVAYDADKNTNESVALYERKLVELLKGHEFLTYIANWNFGFGKGLDDILVLGLRPMLVPA